MTAPVRPSSAAEQVRIFDTTLRDGELASGFTFDLERALGLVQAREASLHLCTNIDPSQLVAASGLVSSLGKFPVSKGIQRFLAGETTP